MEIPRCTARVVDVRPDGTMVVEARVDARSDPDGHVELALDPVRGRDFHECGRVLMSLDTGGTAMPHVFQFTVSRPPVVHRRIETIPLVMNFSIRGGMVTDDVTVEVPVPPPNPPPEQPRPHR